MSTNKDRKYSKAERKRKTKWHKEYNKKHRYDTDETRGRRFTWAEMSLIWNKKLKGGRELTDIQIAKFLNKSLQSIQLKRYKMKNGVY